MRASFTENQEPDNDTPYDYTNEEALDEDDYDDEDSYEYGDDDTDHCD